MSNIMSEIYVNESSSASQENIVVSTRSLTTGLFLFDSQAGNDQQFLSNSMETTNQSNYLSSGKSEECRQLNFLETNKNSLNNQRSGKMNTISRSLKLLRTSKTSSIGKRSRSSMAGIVDSITFQSPSLRKKRSDHRTQEQMDSFAKNKDASSEVTADITVVSDSESDRDDELLIEPNEGKQYNRNVSAIILPALNESFRIHSGSDVDDNDSLGNDEKNRKVREKEVVYSLEGCDAKLNRYSTVNKENCDEFNIDIQLRNYNTEYTFEDNQAQIRSKTKQLRYKRLERQKQNYKVHGMLQHRSQTPPALRSRLSPKELSIKLKNMKRPHSSLRNI